MIRRLDSPIDGVALYLLALDRPGREAERLAVATLGAEILHSAIEHRPGGAPYPKENPSQLISVSHSSSAALLAVGSAATRAIGVDIESTHRTAQLERVRRRFVSAGDDVAVLSLLHLWTAKEAAYKAAGTPGLNLTDIRVSGNGEVVAGTIKMQAAWLPCPDYDALIALAVVNTEPQARR